jgi:hypothetical protein
MLIPARMDSAVAARIDWSSWVKRVPADTWLLAGLVLVGASLRLATLSSQSYWFDEAQAAHELHLSLGAMLSSLTSHETNPPLYFVLGWLWAAVFGTGEAGLRSLSAILGTAAIPVAYLCGRELVSRRAGLIAAALVTLNPFMVWYSQEAREYMLLAVLSGGSLLYFARTLRSPSRRNIAAWASLSGLAVLTHFFAGFLVAPEALWLLYAIRERAVVVAVGAVAAIQAALIPLLFNQSRASLLGFIHSVPLSTRIQQVPVAFGLGTLYQSSIVNYGLVGAAVLGGALILLLVSSADRQELRGAGIAAAIAACVLLAPLLLALLGADYYIPRALIPAWIALAVVIGASCTTQRGRIPGTALAAVLLGAFVYAQVRINDHAQYQRPNWRGVAAALGTPSVQRAIVAYDGGLATDPLLTYLPGAPWRQPGAVPLAVSEIDVVGSVWQAPAGSLPAGASLVASKQVDDFLVTRFRLAPGSRLTPAELSARAGELLPPGTPGAAVLIQRPVA